jgi:hypothetical protein
MAVIDLQMAVEVDTKQLDKLQEKMKQTDELFLKKIEKATTILPKGVEKVNHAWLQMMSKVNIYFESFIECFKKSADLIFSKVCNLNEQKNYFKSNFIIIIMLPIMAIVPAMNKRTEIIVGKLAFFERFSGKSLPQCLHTIASSLTSSAQ